VQAAIEEAMIAKRRNHVRNSSISKSPTRFTHSNTPSKDVLNLQVTSANQHERLDHYLLDSGMPV